MQTLYDLLETHRKNKNDNRVFGLLIQGGGMRAVYSAAAMAPLIQYGFSDTFEHVVGSSAGGINGAYFLGADKDTMAFPRQRLRQPRPNAGAAAGYYDSKRSPTVGGFALCCRTAFKFRNSYFVDALAHGRAQDGVQTR